MNNLGFIEKLLDGEQVEWVKLGDVAEIGTGRSNRQDEVENGEYPFYVRSKNILRSSTFQFDETAIVIPGEGGIGDIFHYVQGKYALHQRAYRIRVNDTSLDTKYLYHFMGACFKQYILMKSVGATSISIRKPMLEGFSVPIPCPDKPEKSLAIQAEIVRILDAFTAMTSELTSELNARQKQYNYYRDLLLSEAELSKVGFEWKNLEEIAKIQRGKRLVKSQLAEVGEYPVYQNSMTPLGYYHEANVQPDTTFVIAAGAAGEIGYSSNELWAADDVFYIENPSHLLSKYLYHFLLIKQYKIKAQVRRASIPRLPRLAIEKIKIPIPSLEEQARIVAILDKFDTLTSSLSEGLPREIELRQQQYEYYRDLLFNFPKDEAA